MLQSSNRVAAELLVAVSFLLGVALPMLMAPATKSSPLVLGLAALLATVAFGLKWGMAAIGPRLLQDSRDQGAILVASTLLYMAISVLWAHNVASSADQMVQLLLPVSFCALLLVFFVPSAPANRLFPWLLAAGITALITVYDLKTGMKLRELTGGRHLSYSYNRTIVTLVVLFWPLLAMAVARGKPQLGLLLLPVFVAAAAGDSETAVLGSIIGIIVLPVAWFAPAFVRRAGLALTVLMLAISPLIGTITRQALGATLHTALANAHSDDRVNIWLSFEAAARQRWFFGNGFGSSLNLQNGSVANIIPPELVTLLGASHPHNAFLQVWVELGLVGALLFVALAVLLFSKVGRMATVLQPFALTCIAVVAGIALVSHGAWQAWWIAAVGAAIVSFAALDHELRERT